MSEFYVFNNKGLANGADNYISVAGGCPRTGTKNGKPVPDHFGKTIRWGIPQQRIDGKWILPRLPEELRNQQPDEVVNDFNANFPHTIEIFDYSWLTLETI